MFGTVVEDGELYNIINLSFKIFKILDFVVQRPMPSPRALPHLPAAVDPVSPADRRGLVSPAEHMGLVSLASPGPSLTNRASGPRLTSCATGPDLTSRYTN